MDNCLQPQLQYFSTWSFEGGGEDFQPRITELTDKAVRLRVTLKIYETASNELVSEVHAKDAELSELKDELRK